MMCCTTRFQAQMLQAVCGLLRVASTSRTCTVRSASRLWYCFLLLEISMSFPCASFTMLCTELSLACSTLIRDSLSCLEYSLHAKTWCQIILQTGRRMGEE